MYYYYYNYMIISKKKKNEPTIEEIYRSMSDHEHILKLNDTYIGGIEEDDIKMWVYDEINDKMVFKTIKYIPGLYKIFDEILVNARDQKVIDNTCNEIRVSISSETGIIIIWNNGEKGIPIEWHKIDECYVPELIFGRIRTSSHYDQTKKITGGKNGINFGSSEYKSTC